MSSENKSLLSKGIGGIGAALLVLNGLIGAGIFALPAKMAAELAVRHGHKGQENKQDNSPQKIGLVVIHLAISSCFNEPDQRHCSGMA